MAEIFKRAVHLGLVHAPPHGLARSELASTATEVRTKDTFDGSANVTYTLLHDHLDTIDELSALHLRGSLPGGQALRFGHGDSRIADQFRVLTLDRQHRRPKLYNR